MPPVSSTASVFRWAAALLLVLLVTAVAGAAAYRPPSGLPEEPLPAGSAAPAELPGIHNVFRLSEKLYSGSSPEGDAGFESLRRLGIRTLISVDGAKPDFERARRDGMRYVHLPFGYDGCASPTALRIVRAIRDLPGPVYIHCHHGRHRGPTAAVLARIALDGISSEEALREMERMGTGAEYTGLYDDVRSFQAPDAKVLDRIPADFPEISPAPPMVEGMVQIQQRFDRLLRAQRAGWSGQADAAHEALQLRELFIELNRVGETPPRTAEFRDWMAAGARDARRLETMLRARRHAEASRFLGSLAVGCGSCHAKYRNVP